MQYQREGEGGRTRTKHWEARVGQLAVYPGQGVVRIEELRDQKIGGRSQEFLVLRVVEGGALILVPREKANQVGLRTVIKRREAARVWEILRTHPPRRRRARVIPSRRFREYREKLNSGSLFEIAEVLRDLLRLQLEKELSFEERRVLDSAQSLIVHELAAAEKKATERIEAQIRDSVD